MAAYEVLLLNTAVPQIQAAQSGDTYVVPRDIAFSAALTLSAGTANGVPYLNASKVLTTGSALTFDGNTLGVATTAGNMAQLNSTAANGGYLTFQRSGVNRGFIGSAAQLSGGSNDDFTVRAESNLVFSIIASEGMRLTSTGLGIGTNNPTQKLTVNGVVASIGPATALTASSTFFDYNTTLNLGRFAAVGNTTGTAAPIYFSQYSSNASVGRDAMIIDSSGNLGLGVTPSAWWSAIKPLQMSGNGFVGSASNYTYLGANFFYDSSANPAYVASAAASLYEQGAGGHRWFNAPSGTANSDSVTSGASYTVVALGSSTLAQWQAFFNDSSNNPLTVTPTLGQVLTGNATGTLLGGGLVTQNISFTQAMTLDASGNLGIGPTNPSAYGKLAVDGNIALVSYTQTMYANKFQIVSSSGDMEFLGGSSNILFKTGGSNTERARITSGGSLIVGPSGTSLFDAERISIASASSQRAAYLKNDTALVSNTLVHNAGTSSDNIFIGFGTEATYTGRGSIDYDRAGGLVRYNTTSDYRAKDILGPLQNVGATIDALKVYEGVMKGATRSRPMLVAHEAQEHAPYAVSGVKDELNEDGTPKYQQMDVSSLVPLLLAEIQSLRARVAQLEQGA